tara:strand:+ start:1541 stop:2323 length:783 start_codon:yes stop_codon:yes gene_type:complete
MKKYDILKEIDNKGYCVLKNVLPKKSLLEIESRLNSYYKKDHEKYGKDFLIKINDLENIRNVIEYDDLFLELLEEDHIIDSLMESLLHKNVILHNYNLIRLFPDIKTNMLGHKWHRDVFYFGDGIRTAVNVIIPLQKVTEENGGTMVLPGSHLTEELPDQNYIDKNKLTPTLEVGDVLIVDAACYHSAGNNQTTDTRTIIVLKYTLSFFTQQYDFCKALPVEKYSEKMKGRLGYYVRVPENIREFRSSPEDRKYKWSIRY